VAINKKYRGSSQDLSLPVTWAGKLQCFLH
jgi:hypothetical protein